MPLRANIIWTNILQYVYYISLAHCSWLVHILIKYSEFAGALGDVKELGVRPINDHHKGSLDSLISSVTANKSSLARAMLASSSENLTTTEMEEYERDDELPSYIGSSDGSESSDRVESEIDEDKTGHAVDVDSDDTDGDIGDHCHSDPGSGYSSSGGGGGSADDDEDSKLRALLHQVGRTYVGYNTGRDVSSARRRLASNQRKEVEETRRQNTYTASPPMGLPISVNREGLGKLSHSAGNARLGNTSIDSSGTPATKSTLVQGNYTLAANENTKPSGEKDLQTDSIENGEFA